MDHKAVYKAMVKSDAAVQFCPACSTAGSKKSMDPHHPEGRSGAKLLIYMWVHRSCHRAIHAEVGWAESLGLLLPRNK